MTDNNLLEEIKTKEDELEALLQRTKEEAQQTINDAHVKAREIEASAKREAEREAEHLSEKEMEAIEKDADTVVKNAKSKAEELERGAAAKFEEVVRLVLDHILPEVSNDSEDE
ncbi:MAG: hypothetical protein ACE5GF_05985 [Thermodesulfobacteriota bacterium]